MGSSYSASERRKIAWVMSTAEMDDLQELNIFQ